MPKGRPCQRRRLVIALLLVPALFAAACGEDSEPGGGEQASFELRYGVVLPFSGDLAHFGENYEEASRLALDVIEQALEEEGLDDRITVSIAGVEDDQTTPTAGVEAATKLVQTDDVQVIIGALASSVTIPIAESVSIPNEIVQISAGSTSPAITDLDDDGFVWRTGPSDALQGQVLAQAVGEEFGSDATINTGARNDAYGIGLTEVFEEFWEKGGGTIAQSVRWNFEAPTFDSEAQQLVSDNPDAWVLIDFPETWAKVGPALVRTGNWDPSLTFTSDGLSDPALPDDVGTEATEGMRGTSPATEQGRLLEAFEEPYIERVGREQAKTGVFAPHTFDSVILAFLAAVSGGSADPDDIRENLRAVSGPPGDKFGFEDLGEAVNALQEGQDIDYEGASGPVDFDENGDPTAAFYEIWRFQGSDQVSERTFPFEAQE